MEKKRFLAVDQGNSFYKLSLFEGDGLSKVCRIPTAESEEIFLVVERWNPHCGAFCSVAHIDPRMLESLRIALSGHLLVLSHSTPLPIELRYSTPYTLGLDRVALAAGAADVFKGENVMIVDAGTAVTLDVISYAPSSSTSSPSSLLSRHSAKDQSVSFLGGRISPGLRLRIESLHGHTAALPLISAEGDIPVVGDSTETSIRAGVIGGLANEIVATFRQYNESFGCSRLALTGGDADLIFNLISSRTPALHVPDLMARGLLYIYNHNENN